MSNFSQKVILVAEVEPLFIAKNKRLQHIPIT